MFHRVKPETQQDPQESRTNPVEEKIQDQAVEAKPFQKPAAAQPERKPAQPQQTFKQEKDVKIMNEKNQDRTFEAQDDNAVQSPRSLEIPPGSYQRPGQPPARAIGGYPGAYPGSSSYGAAHRPDATPTAAQRTLTIGSGITMSGEIESCDYLLVEGTVEAALKGASVLEISESGVFYGTVEINEATIAGRFEGDIKVNGRLTIRASGTITGTIAYKELEVESGAVIDGRLTPVSASQSASKAPSASANNKNRQQQAAPSAKVKSSKEDSQLEAANSDGELFSSNAAAAE